MDIKNLNTKNPNQLEKMLIDEPNDECLIWISMEFAIENEKSEVTYKYLPIIKCD